MEQKDYRKDISQIKDMMSRSSRFISLSGFSGILAGVYAIAAAVIAWNYLLPKTGETILLQSRTFKLVVILLLLVAALSLITSIVLTTRKAKLNNEKVWDAVTRRLLFNFFLPLITGGILIALTINDGNYGLMAAMMLIFYGLALVNASKFTIGTIKFLGYSEIFVGLICAGLPQFGFWFWLLGFGVLHIVYGILMYINEKTA